MESLDTVMIFDAGHPSSDEECRGAVIGTAVASQSSLSSLEKDGGTEDCVTCIVARKGFGGSAEELIVGQKSGRIIGWNVPSGSVSRIIEPPDTCFAFSALLPCSRDTSQ
eukprot:Polyplicarium_translucidae@DN3316_c0_g1_i10.p2